MQRSKMCLHIRYFLLRASLEIVGKSHQWWKKTETHLAEVSLSSWFSHPGSLLLRDHHLQMEFIQIEDTFINQSLCSFTSDRERPKDKIGFSWQEWHLHWMLYAMGIYFLTCKLNLPKTGDEKYKKRCLFQWLWDSHDMEQPFGFGVEGRLRGCRVVL